MDLERTVEELKNDIHLLAMFYAKDFGSVLTGVQSDVELYLIDPSQERKGKILEGLGLLYEFYRGLPRGMLLRDKRYMPHCLL